MFVSGVNLTRGILLSPGIMISRINLIIILMTLKSTHLELIMMGAGKIIPEHKFFEKGT
jgi:hypothetical protein